jgi:hypothetical protein
MFYASPHQTRPRCACPNIITPCHASPHCICQHHVLYLWFASQLITAGTVYYQTSFSWINSGVVTVLSERASAKNLEVHTTCTVSAKEIAPGSK